MKVIKERRKGNYILAITMLVIFVLNMIVIWEYYKLQARYCEALHRQTIKVIEK